MSEVKRGTWGRIPTRYLHVNVARVNACPRTGPLLLIVARLGGIQAGGQPLSRPSAFPKRFCWVRQARALRGGRHVAWRQRRRPPRGTAKVPGPAERESDAVDSCRIPRLSQRRHLAVTQEFLAPAGQSRHQALGSMQTESQNAEPLILRNCEELVRRPYIKLNCRSTARRRKRLRSSKSHGSRCRESCVKQSSSSHCPIEGLSSRIEKGADVAQLVEQSIRNRQVIGSSPIVGSI
jgi:hypothetical protein